MVGEMESAHNRLDRSAGIAVLRGKDHIQDPGMAAPGDDGDAVILLHDKEELVQEGIGNISVIFPDKEGTVSGWRRPDGLYVGDEQKTGKDTGVCSCPDEAFRMGGEHPSLESDIPETVEIPGIERSAGAGPDIDGCLHIIFQECSDAAAVIVVAMRENPGINPGEIQAKVFGIPDECSILSHIEQHGSVARFDEE